MIEYNAFEKLFNIKITVIISFQFSSLVVTVELHIIVLIGVGYKVFCCK